MKQILIYDDETDWCESLKRVITRNFPIASERVFTANNKSEAFAILLRSKIDIVFLDLIMPDTSGEDILQYIHSTYPHTLVIIVSGLNNVDTAVRCMQYGAIDYVVKSMAIEELIARISKAFELCELRNENNNLRKKYLDDTLENAEAFNSYITLSPKIFSLFKYAEAVSGGSQPILITGESGVGKGVFAKIIHNISRGKEPYVALNVAGLDSHMFDDTLFGHTKGAFTGADKERTGVIQAAGNGTVFLDEIGELDIQSQVKLLYLTQDREFRKLGQDNISKTNARFIFATNQNLMHKQEQGLFRNDLYYRLSTHIIDLPPLRERPEDITILTDHFIKEASTELNKKNITINSDAIDILMCYSFPGNVRQLRSIIHDAVASNKTGIIAPNDFTYLKVDYNHSKIITQAENEKSRFATQELETIDTIVNHHIKKVMNQCEYNQTKAAKILGLSQSALSRRIKNILR